MQDPASDARRTQIPRPPSRGRRYLPLAVDVSGWPCLVIGGGRIGTRKALTLVDAGAVVTVLAPEISSALQGAVAQGRVEWIAAEYAPEYLERQRFVIAATADPALNVQIAEDADARELLHNIVSPGRFSRAIFPAVHRHKGLTVAVHTDGRDCQASRALRSDLAAFLNTRKEAQAQLTLLGARRTSLPPEVFALLSEKAACIEPESLSGEIALTVATCQRWETCALTPSPRALASDLRETVQRQTGILLEAHRYAFYLKSGPAAFHHLLRVVSGLDSPLRGETDILGQVRGALARSPETKASPLGQLLSTLMRLQRQVRQSAGGMLSAGWAPATLSLLKNRMHPLASKRIALVGCGRLGHGIARHLLCEGVALLPFSRRARREEIAWCAQAGVPALDTAVLPACLPTTDAVVLTAPVTIQAQEALAQYLAHGQGWVIDLTSSGHDPLRGRPRHFGLSEMESVPQNGAEILQVVEAEKAAVLATLSWLRSTHAATGTVKTLRVGTRGSALALAQVEELREFLRHLQPELDLQVIILGAPGDRDKETPLPRVKQDDFFTRDLDEALLKGGIDVAVHSAKDLPARPRDGLTAAALTPSFAPWEALVTRDGASLRALPAGSRIGTSSARRAGRLKELRPDIETADIRGNVPDRLAQLDAGKYDGLILAAAGLVRLGLHARIAQVFSHSEFPHEPGQGALAIVARRENADIRRFLQPLDLGERGGLPWA